MWGGTYDRLVYDTCECGVFHLPPPWPACDRNPDMSTCVGVRVEDMGHKMGCNGVDNGKLWFDKVGGFRLRARGKGTHTRF